MDSIRIALSEEKIEVGRWLAEMKEPSHGASLVFLGIVRNFNQGKDVIAVSYDAFIPLCRKTLFEICQEAQNAAGGRQNPGTPQILLAHRLGRLAVGEVSLLLAVSSPHRAEAYRCSRSVIENLKIRAPIWKKESYRDGESEWLQGHALCDHAPEREACPGPASAGSLDPGRVFP